MSNLEILIQIPPIVITLAAFWIQIPRHHWIKLILSALVVIAAAAAWFESPFSKIFELFYQHWEIIGLSFILSVIIVCVKYLEYYSKKTYEKIITEKAKHVSIFLRLFDKESLANTTIKLWKKGVCELLYDSLLLLNSGDHQRLFGLLTKTREILKFTANSKFAYYIMVTLKATNNLDEDFLEKEAKNISEITKLKWIPPSYFPKVNLFLESLIREIDSEFSIRKSDLYAVSFSKSGIPPLDKKYPNIRKTACLNFQLWGELYIDSIKYEDFLSFSFFMLVIVGSFWLKNIWFLILWLVYLGFYWYILSGKYSARRQLIGESLEFLNRSLKCKAKKSKKRLFVRLIGPLKKKLITSSSVKNVFSKIKESRFPRRKSGSKKFSFRNAKKLFLASRLLDSLDWLDKMDEEKRYLNLSILTYLITTFPNSKLRNFTPIETLDLSVDFELEEIPKWDLLFALELPFRYLKISILTFIETLKSDHNN